MFEIRTEFICRYVYENSLRNAQITEHKKKRFFIKERQLILHPFRDNFYINRDKR